jgi:hypothetical protein
MKSIFLLLAVTAGVHATEYFVKPNGRDAADGASVSSAFATITKGTTALQPGDTLTVLPGTYFESVSIKVSGTPEAPITIRAQRPGTVLLRGDVDAPAFQPAKDLPRVYVADFKQRIEGVGERSTLRLYDPVGTVREVQNANATYYQDDAAGKVYVHTSDSAPPANHALSISVTNGFGFLVMAPPRSPSIHDLGIDGFSFTGYQSREFPSEPGSRNRWGLGVINGERVTVRRCASFLNTGGIYLLMPVKCLVEDCSAFANVSRFQVVGNNMIGWGVSDTTFRRNVVEAFWQAGSSAGDITFYGGHGRTDRSSVGVMEDNIAINAGIMIKGESKGSIQRNNAAVGPIAYYYQEQDATNLLLRNFESDQALQTYADPLKHDFRRQGAGTDGNATGVFFVSPGGDDAANGNSLKTAWRTLAHAAQAAQPGDTVYIAAGEYEESLAPVHSGTAEKPIRFLRRGHDRVVLEGKHSQPVGVNLAARSHVTVGGFIIRDFVNAGIDAAHSEGLRIENCIVMGGSATGAQISASRDVVFTHNLLRDCRVADLKLAGSSMVSATGNIFDVSPGAGLECDADSLKDLWTEANDFPPIPEVAKAAVLVAAAGKKYESLAAWQKASSLDPGSLAVPVTYRRTGSGTEDMTLAADSPLIGRGPQDSAIGPFERIQLRGALPIENLGVHESTATTASMEWWTPTQSAETTLEWGEDPSCSNKFEAPAAVSHTASLTNLKPGKTYYYRVTSRKPANKLIFAAFQPDSKTSTGAATPEPRKFQTASKANPPRTFHVSVSGDDHHSGLSAGEALRTVNHAAELAQAGDTVLIHAGTYEETVEVRSSGSKDAPIVFRAAPGETVWMEGSGRFRPTAFRFSVKHYVQIDGLRFRHFLYAPDIAPVISIRGGSNITIRRCFYDGREQNGYVPVLIAASDSDHLLVENTVMINGMGEGVTFSRCPGVTVRHCVFFDNFIRALTCNQLEVKAPVNISHNLFCDNLPSKTYNSFLRIFPLDNLRSDNNAYYARIGETERNIVETNSIHGKTVGYQAPGQYHGETLLLADVQKVMSQEQGSRFGNPGIHAAPELQPKNVAPAEWLKKEMHWDGKAFAPLDFADFIPDANNPLTRAADGKPIGLDPAAFVPPLGGTSNIQHPTPNSASELRRRPVGFSVDLQP